MARTASRPHASGFVPSPYPHDRLDDLRALAESVPGGLVDASVGTPVDPVPDVVVRALIEAAPAASGYPPAAGTPELREAASAWIRRRFGVAIASEEIVVCVGTKEIVASLPRVLSLRDPARDVVLYPAVSYPTYAMGAELAGLRAVPVPLDGDWLLDTRRVSAADGERALVLWLNEPANPTGASSSERGLRQVVEWARDRGIIVASDECYAEFTYNADGRPAAPVTALAAGVEGVLGVHSLSKRSNMAGLRSGFVAGDPELVRYLGEVRKHGGMMTPAPIQAAAAAALADDDHVATQRDRYARRRALALDVLQRFGLAHDGGPSTFYLWLRDAEADEDGWSIARRLAARGLLVAPGELYGPDGARHVRLALTLTDDRLGLALDRLVAREPV